MPSQPPPNKWHYESIEMMKHWEVEKKEKMHPDDLPSPKPSERLCVALERKFEHFDNETQCIYCQLETTPGKKRHEEEIHPCLMNESWNKISEYPGRRNEYNVYIACSDCNQSKGKKSADDFIKWVKKAGYKGKKIPYHAIDIITEWYQENKDYLYTKDKVHIEKMKASRDKIYHEYYDSEDNQHYLRKLEERLHESAENWQPSND